MILSHFFPLSLPCPPPLPYPPFILVIGNQVPVYKSEWTAKRNSKIQALFAKHATVLREKRLMNLATYVFTCCYARVYIHVGPEKELRKSRSEKHCLEIKQSLDDKSFWIDTFFP